MKQYRVSWTGSPVTGPGVSTFYESPSSGVGGADELVNFFIAIAGVVPAGVQWNIPSSGDLIESTNGHLAGSWSDPGTGGTVGSSGGTGFVNGVGARVVWQTNGIYHNQRVRGSTFIVPMATNSFEGAGNLTAAAIATLQGAADALVSAFPTMGIFSNPRGGTDGEFNPVVSALVKDQVSWLRSRRT